MEIQLFEKYVDEYGQVWSVEYNKMNDDLMLWNDELGWGLVDGGRGLARILN
jgi:hypothetical protein